MKDVINEIKSHLDTLYQGADFSDIGDAVGFVIGKHESENHGCQLDIFEDGVKHGYYTARRLKNDT